MPPVAAPPRPVSPAAGALPPGLLPWTFASLTFGVVGMLVVEGEFGPATCTAMQAALNRQGAGIVVDGSLGTQTAKALQKHLGVTPDGVVGPDTVRALQRRVGASVDGEWGADTTRHLQTALNAGTF